MYYLKNGVIQKVMTDGISIMIGSENDLANLDAYAGTIAYTAGFGNMWQMNAEGEWIEMANGSGSGGSGSSSGGGTYIVTATWSDELNTSVLDKNYNEIKEAVEEGKCVMIYNSTAQSTSVLYLVDVSDIDIEGSHQYSVNAIGYGIAIELATYLSDSPTGVLTLYNGGDEGGGVK